MAQRTAWRYDGASWIRRLPTICRTWRSFAPLPRGTARRVRLRRYRQSHGAGDLDLLVEFEPLPADAYADAYFELLADLEELFERPVDLVMASALRNPFIRERRSSARASRSMRPEARAYLHDLEQASLLIGQFRHGKTLDDYPSDPLLGSGVER